MNTQSGVNMNVVQQLQSSYVSRANTVKTRAHAKKQQEEETKRRDLQMGLTKAQFWEQKVRTKEDVALYYSIYHPDYPDYVCQSIAARFEQLITKYNTQGKGALTDEEQGMIKQFSKQQHGENNEWDPQEEMNEQLLAGKIALTEKRLMDLLNE